MLDSAAEPEGLTSVWIEKPPARTPVSPRVFVHVPVMPTSSGRTHRVCSSPPSILTTSGDWLARRTGSVVCKPSRPRTVTVRVVRWPESRFVSGAESRTETLRYVPLATTWPRSLTSIGAGGAGSSGPRTTSCRRDSAIGGTGLPAIRTVELEASPSKGPVIRTGPPAWPTAGTR